MTEQSAYGDVIMGIFLLLLALPELEIICRSSRNYCRVSRQPDLGELYLPC